MDEHVAGCSECYEVFAETVQFGLAEGEDAGVMRTGAGAAAPAGFLGRPAFRTVAPLAMAALLLLALGVWSQRARFQSAPLPLVAQLAEAMGTRRFVEPRLTGGFRHGRLTTMRSGDTQQGLDAPPAAYFNRALALERLHLVDAARKAWGDYLQRDSSSGWADEARQHLEALPKARQSSAEEDKARARAAVEGGQQAIDRLADESPSLLRDYFEDELLLAWADAYLVGRPDASLHREHALL